MRLKCCLTFCCLLPGMLAQAQIFPTLDPNAAPPVTKKLNTNANRAGDSYATTDEVTNGGEDVSKPKAEGSTSETSAGTGKAMGTRQGAVTAGAAPQELPMAFISAAYILGPEDMLLIRVVDMDELGDDPYPVDLNGNITLPRVGRVHAAGLSAEELQALLTRKFKDFLQEPAVTVRVVAYHSQPVSVLGAVEKPGIHQIQGNRTLFEVISEAGGLKPDAGNTITITRELSRGPLPLPDAKTDPSGRYNIAQVNIRELMAGRSPQDNVPVLPFDVIAVPKAELVYVIGAVKKPGGFALTEKSKITVLQALSLSEGLDRAASSSKAKILRDDEATNARVEIPVDIKKILAGKSDDQPLHSNDILFIPTSAAKVATARALEAIINTGSGIAIYRP